MTKPTPHGPWWRGSAGPREGMPVISRRPRAVRVDPLELELRLLLAALPVTRTVAVAPELHSVQFIGTSTTGTSQVTQVVTQQAGTATVQLSDMSNTGPLQVQVKTDPSPAVGVNVGAVYQTVTFSEGQTVASLSVPILAGAPNPGEVDVTLTATPINAPAVTSPAPLVLRILASGAGRYRQPSPPNKAPPRASCSRSAS